jgi:hypothetical protein
MTGERHARPWEEQLQPRYRAFVAISPESTDGPIAPRLSCLGFLRLGFLRVKEEVSELT